MTVPLNLNAHDIVTETVAKMNAIDAEAARQKAEAAMQTQDELTFWAKQHLSKDNLFEEHVFNTFFPYMFIKSRQTYYKMFSGVKEHAQSVLAEAAKETTSNIVVGERSLVVNEFTSTRPFLNAYARLVPVNKTIFSYGYLHKVTKISRGYFVDGNVRDRFVLTLDEALDQLSAAARE